MTWRDIADTEIAAGQPITAELMAKYLLRDQAAASHPCGGTWAQVSATVTNIPDKTFLRLFVPRSAKYCYIECMAGVSPVTGIKPQMQLYWDDGNDLSFNDYTYLTDDGTDTGNNLLYPKRVQFKPITILTSSRGLIVNVQFKVHPNETVNTRNYLIANLPADVSGTAGYGVRFVS